MHSPEITPVAKASVGWIHKKKVRVAGAVFTLAALATSCSSSPDQSSLAFTEENETTNSVVETTTTSADTTTTVPEPSPTLVDPERELDLDAWRVAVSAEIPSVATSSDDDIETLIELMCGLAETSNGDSEFLDIPLATLGQELELTSEAVELLARTSIELDCPEHGALVDGE